ncbi:MAG: hypothetical protein HC780_25660 [Leptolyngbyaceae cyanobacterium CSU_1_3]|nr:hypothetical protein [Leptolyngbyaceae cyanobacterium CSU_1_3]
MPAFILLVIFCYRKRKFLIQKSTEKTNYGDRLIFLGVLLCLLYNEVMFFRLPHEYGYLFPVLFSVVYIIAIAKQSRFLICLTVLHLLYGLVFNFDIIQTYQDDAVSKTIHADSAKIQFSIKEGVLVRDVKWRSIYQKYQLEEFNKRWSANLSKKN